MTPPEVLEALVPCRLVSYFPLLPGDCSRVRQGIRKGGVYDLRGLKRFLLTIVSSCSAGGSLLLPPAFFIWRRPR